MSHVQHARAPRLPEGVAIASAAGGGAHSGTYVVTLDGEVIGRVYKSLRMSLATLKTTVVWEYQVEGRLRAKTTHSHRSGAVASLVSTYRSLVRVDPVEGGGYTVVRVHDLKPLARWIETWTDVARFIEREALVLVDQSVDA